MICNLRFLTSVTQEERAYPFHYYIFVCEAAHSIPGIFLAFVGLTLMASIVIFRCSETY
jgi:hypothetical protein